MLLFGHHPAVLPDGFFGGHGPVLLAALGVGGAAELVAAAPADSVFFFFLYPMSDQTNITFSAFTAAAGSGLVPPVYSVAPTSGSVDPSS